MLARPAGAALAFPALTFGARMAFTPFLAHVAFAGFFAPVFSAEFATRFAMMFCSGGAFATNVVFAPAVGGQGAAAESTKEQQGNK